MITPRSTASMMDTANSDTDMMTTMGRSDDGAVRAPVGGPVCLCVCAHGVCSCNPRAS